MPNLVAISQATAKINRGVESTPPPGIECFKSPRSDRVNSLAGHGDNFWHGVKLFSESLFSETSKNLSIQLFQTKELINKLQKGSCLSTVEKTKKSLTFENNR